MRRLMHSSILALALAGCSLGLDSQTDKVSGPQPVADSGGGGEDGSTDTGLIVDDGGGADGGGTDSGGTDSGTGGGTDGGPTGDEDGDGWTVEEGDCDDSDPSIYPGAPDTWYDGVDSDCDEANDFDADGDGHTSADHSGTDCDDADGAINPDADDLCDDIDQDCDGTKAPAWAITLDGTTNHPTISDALAAAGSGSTITVCSGTYGGDLVVVDDVTLVSHWGADMTTLQGSGASSVIEVQAGAFTLDGFTVTHGVGSPLAGITGRVGGGLQAARADDLTVSNCAFSANQASFGGGLAGPHSATTTVSNSVFDTNSATTSGGAIHMVEGLIQDSVLQNNKAGYGGGIMHEGQVELLAVELSGNTAVNQGGGILAYGRAALATLDDDTVLSGNSAQLGGGIATNSTALDLGMVQISGNDADYGGGIYAEGTDIGGTKDTEISGNTATLSGGGAYLTTSSLDTASLTGNSAAYGGAAFVEVSSTISNAKMEGNSASDYGGAIMVYAGTKLALDSVSLDGNRAGSYGGGILVDINSGVSMTSCEVLSNTAGSVGGGLFLNTGPSVGTTSFTSTTSDWGTGASDNSTDDVYFNGTSYTYESAASFTCLDSTGTCR
jgi:predicted outer membrane repeat protein